jgi:hypothetical protein
MNKGVKTLSTFTPGFSAPDLFRTKLEVTLVVVVLVADHRQFRELVVRRRA